jgi:hypothetical protein
MIRATLVAKNLESTEKPCRKPEGFYPARALFGAFVNVKA